METVLCATCLSIVVYTHQEGWDKDSGDPWVFQITFAGDDILLPGSGSVRLRAALPELQ
jgi:hypothetical protein